MTGKQHAVLWMGLLLIIVNVFRTGEWSAIWGTIGNGSPVSFSGGGRSSSSANVKAAEAVTKPLTKAPGSSNGDVLLLPNGIPIINPKVFANVAGKL